MALLRPGGFKSNRFDLQSAAPGAPGAGNNLVWTVPDGLVVEIQSIVFRFSTDANAVDRVIIARGENTGGSPFALSPAVAVQTASKTFTHSFAVGIMPADYSTEASRMFSCLACCIFLEAGEDFVIDVRNIQAGDSITNIELRYLEWTTF